MYPCTGTRIHKMFSLFTSVTKQSEPRNPWLDTQKTRCIGPVSVPCSGREFVKKVTYSFVPFSLRYAYISLSKDVTSGLRYHYTQAHLLR